jgi:hypothetical protein
VENSESNEGLEITRKYQLSVSAIIEKAMYEEDTRKLGPYPTGEIEDDKTEEQIVIFF